METIIKGNSLSKTFCNIYFTATYPKKTDVDNETIEQYIARISTGKKTITEEQFMQMRD